MDIERRKNPDPFLGEAEQDLMTLVDLQHFLAEELSESVDLSTDFSKSFTPLTDGLGIHSVKPRPQIDPLLRFPAELPRTFQEEAVPTPPMRESQSAIDDLLEEQIGRPVQPTAKKVDKPIRPVARFVDESAVEDHFESESEAPVTSYKMRENRLKHALGDEQAESTLPSLDTLSTPAVPPPLPRAGVVRRAMAALMDQIFVWTLAVLSLVLITGLYSSSGNPLSPALLKDLARPEVVKYLIAGFCGLWLLYLTFTIGILESTFGMWIWGMKIGYGEDQRFFKKVARIGLSAMVQVLIVPGVLMIIQRDGRNIIDSLSGTQVLRTPS